MRLPNHFVFGRRVAQARHRSTAAFTLVEMMVAVTMISILAMLAMGSYRGYMLHAARVEVKSTLRMLYILAGDHHDETPLQQSDFSGCLITTNPDGWNCAVTDPLGPTCNLPNGIGFQLDHCEKSRYEYSVTILNSGGYMILGRLVKPIADCAPGIIHEFWVEPSQTLTVGGGTYVSNVTAHTVCPSLALKPFFLGFSFFGSECVLASNDC